MSRIDDIRLLRASDPRVAAQTRDLEPYRPVSMQPGVARDLSLVVAGETGAEELGDRVRTALGDGCEVVESVVVHAETPYAALRPAAVQRRGIRPDQKNLLVRVCLRALDRTLTHAECNALRDPIDAALHEGTAWEWASRGASTSHGC